MTRSTGHNRRSFLKAAAASVAAASAGGSMATAAMAKATNPTKKSRVGERDRNAARMREKRQQDRTVEIPWPENLRRRRKLEQDDVAWLMYYFGQDSGTLDPFTYEFTEQQQEMIKSLRKAICEGGDQAIAASRGEGKTTLGERVLLKYVLQGVVPFGVIFAATGKNAENILESIKAELEENERLRADYPEVCVPVLELENTPNRAHYMLVSGQRMDNKKRYEGVSAKFSWCGPEIVLPCVPGSPSNGAIIATRGLDSAVRGLKRRGQRPSVALIDDPDTEETARSEEQAKKLKDRIDKTIGALGSQKRRIARIMLTTLQSRIAASYHFTDDEASPSWHPRRFRFLVEPPTNGELWEDYIAMRREDWQNSKKGKPENTAHEFYLANRAAMDLGAVVSNPNRFDPEAQASALEFYHEEIARTNREMVATEYDNDPPEETGPVESGISATAIQWRLSGFEKAVVPDGCVLLTQGMDIGKMGSHWVVRAWREDGSVFTIDYGYYESHGVQYGSDEGIEQAVYRMIVGRMEQISERPYTRPDGEVVPVDLTLVDSGYQASAVYAACKAIGMGIYPAKGHGKSMGCATINFSPHIRRNWDTKPGDGWYMKRQGRESGGVWLVHCDTDRWKAFEHARWMTGEDQPGAGFVFGSIDETERHYMHKRMPRAVKDHHGFARHLTAEIEVEEVVRGMLKRHFKPQPGRAQNHWLDASYLSDVAAAMKGIRVIGESTGPVIVDQRERPRMTLREMAKGNG